MKKILLVSLILALVSLGAFAQTKTSDEMVSIPKSQLTAQQLASVQQANLQSKIEQYGKWVGLGKEVGEAVNGSLSALTKQAEEFSKTGVGKFTMFMIAWKVLGNDLTQFVVGVPLFAVGFVVWIISFWKNGLPRQDLLSVSADGKKEYRTENPDSEQQIGHFVVLLIWGILCVFLIFA